MASIFLALRNPEKLKTRFPGSLRLGRPPVELRAETSATLTFVLPSTVTFISTFFFLLKSNQRYFFIYSETNRRQIELTVACCLRRVLYY